VRWRASGAIWNKDVADSVEAAGYADMADHGEEDEVGVHPALDLPEPVGLPSSHGELVRQVPPLAGYNELVCLPERVAQPSQRPDRLRICLQVRQQLRDNEDPARHLLALLPVLPSPQRSLHDHGDEPADVRADQLRHRRRLAQPGPQSHGSRLVICTQDRGSEVVRGCL
jgi:hypothetical protein